jgi:hypothetical protein
MVGEYAPVMGGRLCRFTKWCHGTPNPSARCNMFGICKQRHMRKGRRLGKPPLRTGHPALPGGSPRAT